MNRKVLFLKVAAAHLLILGFVFGLMNGCERKREGDYRVPSVAVQRRVGEPEKVAEKPEEIVEKEEPLVIKEYGKPGAVKRSELAAGAAGKREERVHEVKKGETLSGIAQDYGVSLKAVMEVNAIKDPGKIQVGQEIRLPGS